MGGHRGGCPGHNILEGTKSSSVMTPRRKPLGSGLWHASRRLQLRVGRGVQKPAKPHSLGECGILLGDWALHTPVRPFPASTEASERRTEALSLPRRMHASVGCCWLWGCVQFLPCPRCCLSKASRHSACLVLASVEARERCVTLCHCRGYNLKGYFRTLN